MITYDNRDFNPQHLDRYLIRTMTKCFVGRRWMKKKKIQMCCHLAYDLQAQTETGTKKVIQGNTSVSSVNAAQCTKL